jgi:hypothetical protein
LAGQLDNAATTTGWIASGGFLGTALAGAGEGFTLGGDTPVTITFGSVSLFFGSASTLTAGAASALNSYAGGNLAAVRNFGWGQLANLAATAAASKIPIVKPWADTIGDLAERGSDLALQTREACQ